MTTDKHTQTWEVELLTPLHIGDGTEMLENQDYISNPKLNTIDVIEFETLLESLSDYPKAIDDLGHSISLNNIQRDYRIEIPVRYSLKSIPVSFPKNLRRFLKNGHGQPYIAGSSLKGAIHTALWTSLDRSNLPPVRNNYRDFNTAVKTLGGKDPYHMFIRPLQISDSIGIEPKEALICNEIKFFNLQRDNQPGWKNFAGPNRQTIDEFQKAAGLFVECLKPKIKLHLQARLDPFFTNSIKKISKITPCSGISDFQKLFHTINAHSLHLANRERSFFAAYKPATALCVDFYKELIGKIETASSNSETCIVRLSWGSGWRGMTGDWLTDDNLRDVREQRPLGRRGVEIFPKTRRLAIDPVKGIPCLPLGWVKISVVKNDKFSITDEPIENAHPEINTQPPAIIPNEPPPDPEAEFKSKLLKFQGQVKNCKNFQSEVEKLISVVNDQQEDRMKQAMCAILSEKAKGLPNKSFEKAKKENKKWATTLSTLFEANGC